MSAIDAARRYVDAWNARDAARLAGSFRPGGTYQDPSTDGPIQGRPLGHYAGALWSAFPDLVFEERGFAETAPGEMVLRWTMRGTYRGWLRGLPPTGATVELPGADFITARDDGVQRVEGYFDRAAFMEQLGAQVTVQPVAVGPMRFGAATSVRSDNPAPPGAVSLTMIEAESEGDMMQIRETSRRIMLELRRMPGFLSFQGAVIGRRFTTVTLWESPEAQRQMMREADHKYASQEMFGGSVGSAFHTSSWALERLGELWTRCVACGALHDARAQVVCRCGLVGARPAFW